MIERKWLFLLGTVAVVLVGLNLTTELEEEGTTIVELALDSIEVVLMVIGAGGVGVLFTRMRADHDEKLALIRNLGIARSQGEAWRSKVQTHVSGLANEMQKQFVSWSLTAAESEVGLLMLKGLSHKEIAAVRGTSEATVRQQARSIYQKSELPNKTAFAAFFLEDLLLPVDMSQNLLGEDNPVMAETDPLKGSPENLRA